VQILLVSESQTFMVVSTFSSAPSMSMALAFDKLY